MLTAAEIAEFGLSDDEVSFFNDTPTVLYEVPEISFRAEKHSREVPVDPAVAVYVNSCSKDELKALNSADLFTPGGRPVDVDHAELEQREMIATQGKFSDITHALPSLEGARPFTERFAGSKDGSILERFSLPDSVELDGEPPDVLAQDVSLGDGPVLVFRDSPAAHAEKHLKQGKHVIVELRELDLPCEVVSFKDNPLTGMTVYHLKPGERTVRPSCYDIDQDMHHYEQIASGDFFPTFSRSRRLPRSWQKHRPKQKSSNRYEGKCTDVEHYVKQCRMPHLPPPKEGYVFTNSDSFAFCDLLPVGPDFLSVLVYHCGQNNWAIEYDEQIGHYVLNE